MTFNHRVVRHTDATGETCYQVHEVYYTRTGRVKLISRDGFALSGASRREIVAFVPLYLKALTEPVIDFKTRKEVEPPVSMVAFE